MEGSNRSLNSPRAQRPGARRQGAQRPEVREHAENRAEIAVERTWLSTTFALRTYEKHGRPSSRRRVRRRLSSVFKRGGRRRRRPPAHCGCLEHTHRQRGRLRPLHHHSHPAHRSRKDRFRRIVIFTRVAPARLGRRVCPRACTYQEISGARQRAVVRVRRRDAGHQPGAAALHVLGS